MIRNYLRRKHLSSLGLRPDGAPAGGCNIGIRRRPHFTPPKRDPMTNSRRLFSVRAGATIAILLSAAAALGQQLPSCGPKCSKLYSSHEVLASDYPFSEDITGLAEFVLVTWDPAQPWWNQPWTTIQSRCPVLPGPAGNIVNSVPTNELLRANVSIHGPTSNFANGIRMEIQLTVDDVEYGHFVRRLRGLNYTNVDDSYEVASTAQNLPAGTHTFSVKARLLDNGTVYASAFGSSFGVPYSLYQSQKQVVNGTPYLTLSAGTFAALTPSLTINQNSPVDLALQGYAQVDSASGASTLIFRFLVDGTMIRESRSAIPPVLYDGINVIDHWNGITTGGVLPGLSAGPHTIQLVASTDAGTAVLENRQADFVAFPHGSTSPVNETATTLPANQTLLIDSCVKNCTTAAQPQPSAGALNDYNVAGYWTLIGTTTVPADAQAGSWMLDGYVQFKGRPGNPGSSVWGQVAFETITRDGPCIDKFVDMGLISFMIPSGNTGIWIHGDAGPWGTSAGVCNTPTIVKFWIRPVGFGNQFYVGDRYMSVKLTPISSCACRYDKDPVVGSRYFSVAPCRAIDTRYANGSYGSPALQGLQDRLFTLSNVCGVPSTATAVMANVTVTGSTDFGALEIFPAGQPPGVATSTVNYGTGKTRANNANLELGCSGQIDVHPLQPSTSTVNMILDIYGYYQ